MRARAGLSSPSPVGEKGEPTGSAEDAGAAVGGADEGAEAGEEFAAHAEMLAAEVLGGRGAGEELALIAEEHQRAGVRRRRG